MIEFFILLKNRGASFTLLVSKLVTDFFYSRELTQRLSHTLMWNFSGTPSGGTCPPPGHTMSLMSSPVLEDQEPTSSHCPLGSEDEDDEEELFEEVLALSEPVENSRELGLTV